MPVTVTDSATIGLTDHWQTTIEERQRHIRNLARCQGCGTDAATCDAGRGGRKGPEGLCCWGGLPGHGHVEDPRLVSELLREVASGSVRTVAELDPPKLLGPEPVTSNWTLWQGTWWYPHRRPAILIAEMDDCHRYNTAEYLKRRAPMIVREQYLRMAFGPQPSGDMACDAFDDELNEMLEHPISWLCGRPLLRALREGLPTVDNPNGSAARSLVKRARHWHTCPMRLLSRQRPRGAVCTCPPRRSSTETYPEPG